MNRAYILCMYMFEGQPLSELCEENLTDYRISVLWRSQCEDIMRSDAYLSDGAMLRSD